MALRRVLPSLANKKSMGMLTSSAQKDRYGHGLFSTLYTASLGKKNICVETTVQILFPTASPLCGAD